MARSVTQTLVLSALAGVAGAAAVAALSRRSQSAEPMPATDSLGSMALSAALTAGVGAAFASAANALQVRREARPDDGWVGRGVVLAINAGIGALTTYVVRELHALLSSSLHNDHDTLRESDSNALLQAPPERSQIH